MTRFPSSVTRRPVSRAVVVKDPVAAVGVEALAVGRSSKGMRSTNSVLGFMFCFPSPSNWVLLVTAPLLGARAGIWPCKLSGSFTGTEKRYNMGRAFSEVHMNRVLTSDLRKLDDERAHIPNAKCSFSAWINSKICSLLRNKTEKKR